MKNEVSISMYHYTRDLAHSRYPNIKGLAYDLFEQQLQFFAAHFSVVTMEAVIHALEPDGKPLPEHALLLTFDDGYIDNFTVALPLLKKYGMQGSFFIPGKTFSENVLLDVNKIHFVLASADNPKELVHDLFQLLDEARRGPEYRDILDNESLYAHYAAANRFDSAEIVFCKQMLQTVLPEKLRNEITSALFARYVGQPEANFAREVYMNADQISCLKANGMFIGLHGYDHYWLSELNKADMERDIDKALEVMAPFINKEAWVMNYPYGVYNQDVIDYIQARGCILGLTTDVAKAELTAANRYTLPRFDCNDFPPRSENYLKYQG